MVIPLIAAADVKEKNRLLKQVRSEKVDCKKGKLWHLVEAARDLVDDYKGIAYQACLVYD
jgi:hypothetical protein